MLLLKENKPAHNRKLMEIYYMDAKKFNVIFSISVAGI